MFKKWSNFEKWLLIVATMVILGLSIYWRDTPLGMVSSLTGVICVILTAKGTRSCYVFGLINIILYVIISYSQKFYGEVMLNALYYLPMQFIGFYMWSKNLTENGFVKAKRLNIKQQLFVYILSAISIFIYGYILKQLGGKLPYIDSMSTVLSVTAMYLSIKRYAEQWVMWIVVDIVSIIMWAIALTQGSTDMATMLMWTIYLVNAVYGLIKWEKESKLCEK